MRRALILAVAVVVVTLVVVFGFGLTRAGATDGDETVTTNAVDVAFTVQADELAVRSGAHCWAFTADHALVAYTGRVQAWPALEAEWCGGRHMRKVTDLVYLRCFSKGGFYSYDGCKDRHGATGYSYLSAGGSWHYHWVINGSVFTKTPSLSIRYYPNGVVTGTWYWQTG